MKLAIGPTYPITAGQYTLIYRCMTKRRKLLPEKSMPLVIPKVKKHTAKLVCPR